MDPVTIALAIKAGSWLVGLGVAAFTANTIVSKFGSTPSNDLRKNGVSSEQQYQDWQEWRKDHKKYYEGKTDEWFSEIKERNKTLEEENKKLAQQMEGADPQEKTRLMAIMSDNKKEIAENNRLMNKKIEDLGKVFKDIGKAPLTLEQFQDKSQQVNLSSWKNWGIIAVCAIIAIMVISFVRKMLSKLANNIG